MQISLTVKDASGKKIFESKGKDQAAHDKAYEKYISASGKAPTAFKNAIQQAYADQEAEEIQNAFMLGQAGL